jgi:NitT/TauT family transport system ATP-binding protein
MSISPSTVAPVARDGTTAGGAGGPIVEVRDISKTYDGGIEALRSINLTFAEGRMTTLLGPSGCGKTTLLKIIAGLLDPTGGEIRVKGKPVSGPGPERAFVFQDFALMPWATVLRNVGFGLELRSVSRGEREEIARTYIEKVGLGGFEGRYPHELSGGMRQRVGLARALAVDADVLLMDEPFSAVDEQTRRLFQEELIHLLEKEHKSVIFVTHSIEEAVYVSDRIVLLSTRPGSVNKIVDAGIDREGKTAEQIRREKKFLDTVDEIWQMLKRYLDEERMHR